MNTPTFRKVRKQGHTPIRYRTENEARNGCIIEKFPQYWLVRLVGEKVTQRLVSAEQRYVTEL